MKHLAALAALAILGGADSGQLLVREQVWTTTVGARDLAYALTHAPRECLSGKQSAQFGAGRALFRSPALLGGPAARTGLSCNACHANGRSNAHFLLPELTNRAGAADVTSEWSSRVRGDGVMNPVDIPDLAGVATRTAFGQRRVPSLERFTHSVIIEEFQGAEPPAPAMALVLAYMRSLDLSACGAGDEPIALADAANDVHRALSSASTASDWPTTSLLIAAAQDAIGRIVERLPVSAFSADRRRLEALARELGQMRGQQHLTLEGWRPRFDAAIARITPRESDTYFNEATLRAALSP